MNIVRNVRDANLWGKSGSLMQIRYSPLMSRCVDIGKGEAALPATSSEQPQGGIESVTACSATNEDMFL
jgi:hypothetical protein